MASTFDHTVIFYKICLNTESPRFRDFKRIPFREFGFNDKVIKTIYFKRLIVKKTPKKIILKLMGPTQFLTIITTYISAHYFYNVMPPALRSYSLVTVFFFIFTINIPFHHNPFCMCRVESWTPTLYVDFTYYFVFNKDSYLYRSTLCVAGSTYKFDLANKFVTPLKIGPRHRMLHIGSSYLAQLSWSMSTELCMPARPSVHFKL